MAPPERADVGRHASGWLKEACAKRGVGRIRQYGNGCLRVLTVKIVQPPHEACVPRILISHDLCSWSGLTRESVGNMSGAEIKGAPENLVNPPCRGCSWGRT